MAERDTGERLRRAVKENNLFLVKRLIQRTDMRNPDHAPRRFTSLAWAAVLGHEETFQFLLSAGHDDEELSKDSESNTILMLLADHIPLATSPNADDITGAALRMARLYFDRYPHILDWPNAQGKTALHLAALKGNEELVRMLCDLSADVDLSDDVGNTPLHYASSWGHIPVVQLLIERGCRYTAKNNEGFTASDYAYSFNTKDTLQDTARLQFENNKRSRRNIHAPAPPRSDWSGSLPIPNSNSSSKTRSPSHRMRSGSGASRTTATSDSGELDVIGASLAPRSQSSMSFSASSSPSQPSAVSGSFFHSQRPSKHPVNGANGLASYSTVSLVPAGNTPSTLSPIVNRMRERDKDEIDKYLNRNRSGSQGTASTESKQIGALNFTSAGPSANGDDITSLTRLPVGGSILPRRLRPSVSAAQLRTAHDSILPPPSLNQESRNRSGTNPTGLRPSLSPLPLLARSSSTTNSSLLHSDANSVIEPESYIGPPSQFARFPDPPTPPEDPVVQPPSTRRKAFHILSKPTSSTSESTSATHRRGISVTSVRGP